MRMAISLPRSEKGRRFLTWQNLILALFAIKLLATIVLQQTPKLASYSCALYGLVLLLAAGLAIQNARKRTLGNRAFWVFLALGCGLWSLDHWIFVYYELGRGMDVPDISIADVTLFFHTILLMAAAAIRPHLDRPAPKLSRSTLNFLLLLFFWVFLYAFLLLPYQYVSWNATVYNERFELLYGFANLVLILAMGVPALRARPPWRSVYASLCGASALVTLVSTVANLANDFGGHYSIRFYAIGKITSVCWIALVPLRARLLEPPQSSSVSSSPVINWCSSLLAVLAVVAVPVMGLWELFRPGESAVFRTFRLSVVLVFVIFLAVAALARELLANRELVVHNEEAWRAAIESEGRFRLIADKPAVMIWVSGTDKLCTFFNQAWLDFKGRSMEEEMGDGWASGVHPDDRERCMSRYHATFDKREPFEMEYRVLRFDGKYRWIVDYGVPRFDPDGTFCGYIGSCIDITDRKFREESLQELGGRLITAQEEERTRVAAELKEDLSQRMALVLVDLDLLARHVPQLSSHVRKQLENISGAIRSLTSDIDDISHRLHPTVLEILRLETVVKGLCAEFSKQHGLQVRFVPEDIPAEVPPDVTLCIFRIVQETLGNIVEHSGAPEAIVELSGRSGALDLSISDSGSGFDVDSMNARTGLGLPSIRERARLVGGTFANESQPSKGTRITVRIQLSRSGVGLDSDQTAREPKT